MGFSSGDITERFQWTFPIVIAPTDPDVALRHLAARLEVDQRRPELAAHQPGPDAPRSRDARAVGRPDHARPDRRRDLRDDLHARAVGRRRQRHLGRLRRRAVHVTRDGGKNWKNVTPPDLPAFTRISLIEASPHSAGTAYLAGNRYQLSDRAPYVYKTADYGKTWTKIVNGLAGDDFARAIREDKKRKRAAVPRHRDRHLRLVRRWRERGSRCSWTCRSRRCTASRSGTTTW